MSDEKINFEASLDKLEGIVEKLQSPDISLDESIKLFEEGIKLADFCSKELESARQRISNLTDAEKEG